MSLEANLSSTSRATSTAIEANLPKANGAAKPEPKAKPEPVAKTKAAKPEPKQAPQAKAKATKPAKQTAPAASAASKGRVRFSDDMVITVKKTDHGKRGNKGLALDCMKSGMTVEQFKAALEKKQIPNNYAGWALKVAVRDGLATVK